MSNRGILDIDIEKFWEDYFDREDNQLKILDLKGRYPEQKFFEVSFTDIDFIATEFAQELLESPDKFLAIGRRVLSSKTAFGDIDIRTVQMQSDALVPISKVGKEHIGRLISVAGVVKHISEVMPKVKDGAFKCSMCPCVNHEPQFDILTPPAECEDCHRKGQKFEFIPEMSTYTDYQRFEIQESPEGLRKGKQPTSLSCYVENSLVNILTPGSRVIFTGIVEVNRGKGAKDIIFTFRLRVVSLESSNEDYEDLIISPEDEARIKELSCRKDIIDILTNSVAPAIEGHREVKESIALQLFGGVPRTTTDGMSLRGDIHILLCGDPGIAKSKLLHYVADMAPRGIFASGKSATSAGLTAAAVKDPLDKDRWVLEAGALVLADGGFAAVDELDKMSEQDRSAMHDAMEGQEIPVNKAGISATLSTRCCILGACNPKYGRFDTDMPLLEQVNLMPTLLSRFDLIHILIDKNDPRMDDEIADRMLDNRMGSPYKMEVLDQDLIRKYIATAKKVNPMMTDDARAVLKANYKLIRKQGQSQKQVSITPRQLDAYIRLSEASARVRLSDLISVDDARRAVRLVSNALNRICPDGDIDVIMTGTSHKEHDKIRIIKELITTNDNNIKIDKLKLLCKEKSIEDWEVDKLLDRMRQNAETVMPRYGFVSLVST